MLDSGEDIAVNDEVLTLPEVADLKKVAEKTVSKMVKRRDIPAFKVGGQWRFQRTDLLSWIELQKKTQQ